jgi:hypothetical protein
MEQLLAEIFEEQEADGCENRLEGKMTMMKLPEIRLLVVVKMMV